MIQPEPKGSAQGYPLDSVEVLRFNTSAGNPVKEILLKLNLPDHRSILIDSKEYIKMDMEALMALVDDELSVGKNHARNGEWIGITMKKLTETSSITDVKENPFIPASLDYDHEMVPKSKDWVERHNTDKKLPNFNTRRILVPKSQAINECLKLTEASTDPESSK
ncbi:hypothetical protein Tco_0412736 [Tanacetum coccineum]